METIIYKYSIRGNLQDTHPNGIDTGDWYKYDDRDQLIEARYSAQGVTGSDPSNAAKRVTYDCGAIDRNSMTVTDNTGTTTTSYVKDNLSQYTSAGGQSISYDNNFNLTAYSGWTYAYDALNRLTSATLLGMSGHSATFTYDGIGRCVRRVIDGVTTILTYDGWRPVTEWDQNGNLIATNIYGIGIDEILFTSNAQGQFFYKSDALGNVRFVLSSASPRPDGLVEQYTYDAFGAPTIKDGNGNQLVHSAIGNRFMFKGREYLDALGVYDYRKRIYHPGLGRFFQSDPIGLAGDPLNLYRFCNHNPLTGNDPMGEDATDYLDPYVTGVGLGGPFSDPFPAFYADQGALDAPVPLDPNTIFPPGGSPGGVSATTVTQGNNMGEGSKGLELNAQSGFDGKPSSPSAAEGTGSNPPYDPKSWNDGGTIQENSNCYAYALNQRGPFNGLSGVDPGSSSGDPITSLSQVTVDNVCQRAIEDGLSPVPIPGGYSVYLVVDPGSDYHWYRQDDNGLWSSKHGSTEVTNVDASGHLIYDPGSANHNYGAGINYTQPGGYLWVPPSFQFNLSNLPGGH